MAAFASPDPISKFALVSLITGASGAFVGTLAAISAYNECKQLATNPHPAAWGGARRGATTAPFFTPVTFRGRRWIPA